MYGAILLFRLPFIFYIFAGNQFLFAISSWSVFISVRLYFDHGHEYDGRSFLEDLVVNGRIIFI
jgi:hypothetical protein